MSLVAEASNGREAVEQYRTHRPDITLMDLQMPEMNGLDAMIAIRAEFPEARIIMLTTYAGDVQVLRAMKVGARGYLLKTLLDKELLETIRAVHAREKDALRRSILRTCRACHQRCLNASRNRCAAADRRRTREQTDRRTSFRLQKTRVKGRVKSILSKLGANDRTHAAMIGVKRGIIQS